MQRWPLRSTFSLFPTLQLGGLVSWEIPGKHFMNGHSFWDFFWSSVLPVLEYCSAVWCSAADSHLKLLHSVVRRAVFVAGGVLEWNLAHRDLQQCCASYLRWRVTQCILWVVHFLCLICRMCRRVLLVVIWLLIGTRLRLLAVELLSTAKPLSPYRCLFGTIVVTLCFLVWDWRVLRAEPILFCWPNLFFSSPTIYFFFFGRRKRKEKNHFSPTIFFFFGNLDDVLAFWCLLQVPLLCLLMNEILQTIMSCLWK